MALSIDEIILSWPGKSAQAPYDVEHPAVFHMLDVAAVAEQLIGSFNHPDCLREAMIFLIALHDLGKISEGFRRMLRGQAAAPKFRHWEVSEFMLLHHDKSVARALGGDPRKREILYAAVAGHHGRPSALKLPSVNSRRIRFGPKDEALKIAGTGISSANEVIEHFAALWPTTSIEGLDLSRAQELSWWLAGICTTADWIGSNTEWFPPQQTVVSLSLYLRESREKAACAVVSAGLSVKQCRSGQLFNFALRPMQAACVEVELPEGPILAVIEDETGAGKTEAALLLAHRMLQAGKGRGVFFALPTMATADSMFKRFSNVAGTMMNMPSLTLAHGRAGLSVDFKDVVAGSADSPDDVTCSSWLVDSRRRALLADVGVGTIDQALLTVLPVRFETLRYFGLSSKILIVDEVHELGEPYICAELEALLRMHRAAGGSVILLTATLPLNQRTKLLAVYGGQANSRAYPALTIAGGAAITDLPQETSAKGAVQVKRLAKTEMALDLIAQQPAKGAACVWIRNSVDNAISAVRALRERGIEADLLHARFTLGDRKRIETKVLAYFGGKSSDRAARVLIGTQVLETSLDLDFDVMISDLAPMAALIQRAGRLWRHMDRRPRGLRPVPGPILHVVSPDPAKAIDESWLQSVFGGGAFVYSLADQWRTAHHIFEVREIVAPSRLRGLVELVHGEDVCDLPDGLLGADTLQAGQNAAARGHAAQNIVDFSAGYRAGGRATDDTTYPTRLGHEQRILVLARRASTGLIPWIEGADGWQLSEVSARAVKLDRLALPDQSATEIRAITDNWPNWKQSSVRVCPVATNGEICLGLSYEEDIGLIFN